MPTSPARSTRSKGTARSGRAGSTARRRPLVPALLGVIVVLGVIAVALSRGGDEGSAPGVAENRPVTVSGSALPVGAGADDAALGLVAPELEGAGFAGEAVTLEHNGVPKLVIFLAHWCPHCRNEVPAVTDWFEQNGPPEGVELISVSTGVDRRAPNYPPSRWLERENWPLAVIADDATGTAAMAYGLPSYPYFVALDGDGRVVGRVTGELGAGELDALVAELAVLER